MFCITETPIWTRIVSLWNATFLMHLTYLGCHGGLFVVDERHAENGGGERSKLLTMFPQLGKRGSFEGLGCFAATPNTRHHLAVDEVAFLRSALAGLQCTWEHDVLLDQRIEDRRSGCREVNVLCAAYIFLTNERGYRLKHGGSFGVHYLVYTGDREGHSEFLAVIVTHEMCALERVALQRLARSVRKRAMLVTPTSDAIGAFTVELLQFND